MTEKEIFIEKLKKRTRKFAVDAILFCNSLKKCQASTVVSYQFIKCTSSVGANYRAACRARSKSEFFSKICIVVEECDESEYWLKIINDADLSDDSKMLFYLLGEVNELIRIMATAKNSTYVSNN